MTLSVPPVDAGRAGHVQDLYDRMGDMARTEGPGQVAPEHEARFAEALDAPDRVHAPSEGPMQVAQAGQDPWVIVPAGMANAPEAARGLADRILDGVVGVRDSWNSSLETMSSMTESGFISPVDMLNMQMQIGATQVMVTVASQEVGTVSQKIDGLLKAG